MKGKSSKSEQIGELVAKIKELGLSYREGADRFGIGVKAIYQYNWLKKRAAQASAVKPEATPAHSTSGASDPQLSQEVSANASSAGNSDAEKETSSGLPQEVVDLICGYRQEHPQQGFRRIEQELRRRHHVAVSRKKIRKVLKQAGLLESCDSSFDQEPFSRKGTRRFEAAYPGELYQMDVTYVYLEKLPTFYLVVVVDDHSRFCLKAELCSQQKGDTLIGVLHDACLEHGRPKKLLTDQGSGFYTWSLGQTRFQQYLDDHRIEHIVCEPHSPQTQGKVERLIQTLEQELLRKVRFSSEAQAREAIRDYVNRYNHDRCHQALDGACPADRFYGVHGEVQRMEGALVGSKIDTSKGFLAFRIHGHTLSAVCCGEGLQVYLDGNLLEGSNGS